MEIGTSKCGNWPVVFHCPVLDYDSANAYLRQGQLGASAPQVADRRQKGNRHGWRIWGNDGDEMSFLSGVYDIMRICDARDLDARKFISCRGHVFGVLLGAPRRVFD
jgi:hypothetical protein